MEIRPQYLQHYLHDIAIDQLTADYKAKGYQVSTNDKIEGYHPDLVARKGDEVVVIEVKAGKLTAEKRRQVAVIGDYVRTHKNHKFLVVLATPPRPKKIDIPNLEQLLFDHLVDTRPEALNRLPKYARISDVTDIVVNELTVSEEGSIAAIGNGIVEITVGNSSSDEDGVLTSDVSPFTFEVKLNYNDNHELYLAQMSTLDINISSFDE